MERRLRDRTALGASSGISSGSKVTGPMSTVAATTASAAGSSSRSIVAPAAVGVDDEPLAVAEPGAVPRPRRGSAIAVAAHLGAAAVGVVQDHRAVGAVGARLERDQPVGADAAVAVAERARRRRARAARDVPSSASWTRKSLPVAWSLASVERCGHGHHHARRAGRTSHGFSAAPNQVMRGSRRNQIRWRRANARVRRTAASSAASRSGSSPSR